MKFVANGNLGGLVILLRRKKVAAEKPVSVGIHCESRGGLVGRGGSVNDASSLLIILLLSKIKIEHSTVHNDLLVHRLDSRLDGHL